MYDISGNQTKDAVSKRVNVTLPDSVFEDLERLAAIQGRPTANLAAFLIEIGLREAKEHGELPEQTPKAVKSNLSSDR